MPQAARDKPRGKLQNTAIMKKSEFKHLYLKRGAEAITELLKETPGGAINLPKERYLPGKSEHFPEAGADIPEKSINMWKAMHVIRGHAYRCSVISDLQNRETQEFGITGIRLKDGIPLVQVFDINKNCFQEPSEIELSRIIDSNAVYFFVRRYVKFDVPPTNDAGDLSERQLELLDEFLAASDRLNRAGVSYEQKRAVYNKRKTR